MKGQECVDSVCCNVGVQLVTTRCAADVKTILPLGSMSISARLRKSSDRSVSGIALFNAPDVHAVLTKVVAGPEDRGGGHWSLRTDVPPLEAEGRRTRPSYEVTPPPALSHAHVVHPGGMKLRHRLFFSLKFSLLGATEKHFKFSIYWEII
jgi:hypothetical protein